MLTFTYQCKKNGKEYGPFELDAALPAQDEYAWRKGLGEYMDNYHASVTKAGIVTYKKGEKVITPWIDEAAFHATVDEFCTEAQERFNAGDVATGKQPNPENAASRALAKAAKAAGIEMANINPEKLVAWLKRQAEMGKAA